MLLKERVLPQLNAHERLVMNRARREFNLYIGPISTLKTRDVTDPVTGLIIKQRGTHIEPAALLTLPHETPQQIHVPYLEIKKRFNMNSGIVKETQELHPELYEIILTIAAYWRVLRSISPEVAKTEFITRT